MCACTVQTAVWLPGFNPLQKTGSYAAAAAKLHQQMSFDKPWYLLDPEVNSNGSAASLTARSSVPVPYHPCMRLISGNLQSPVEHFCCYPGEHEPHRLYPFVSAACLTWTQSNTLTFKVCRSSCCSFTYHSWWHTLMSQLTGKHIVAFLMAPGWMARVSNLPLLLWSLVLCVQLSPCMPR